MAEGSSVDDAGVDAPEPGECVGRHGPYQACLGPDLRRLTSAFVNVTKMLPMPSLAVMIVSMLQGIRGNLSSSFLVASSVELTCVERLCHLVIHHNASGLVICT
jgi:hypothetical protein